MSARGAPFPESSPAASRPIPVVRKDECPARKLPFARKQSGGIRDFRPRSARHNVVTIHARCWEKRMHGWLKSIPVAHRGLHCQDAPENTLAAFQRAVAAGYAIELDVQLSSDGVPVVFHDDDLQRLTGVKGRVSSLEAGALTKLTIGGRQNRIPTLSQVLASVSDSTPLLIELKEGSDNSRLVWEVMRQLQRYHGRFAVQSFSLEVLATCRAVIPAVPRGLLSGADPDDCIYGPFASIQTREMAEVIAAFDFEGVGLTGQNRDALAAFARRVSYPVLLWTVRLPSDARFAEESGFNLIFEEPVAPTRHRRDGVPQGD